ncbi:Uncharacterised protein [Bordetella ansorpii]|uniref:Uncharacterized protein n=1 Tax=Bordetella ansorpii TaxID=288768 RepID=A0A157SVF8_9BORD|nr:hypothetical protein [Bordetella ansorpii]SAI74314.1 Uncharacterised protein [Bordetella ansorpii]
MKKTITPMLLSRPQHTPLDDTPIHVGDIVHLQPAEGPSIRAQVIYNAPLNGTVTYTTDLVRCNGGDASKQTRIRFRHEHVHRVESVQRRAAAC